MKSSPSRRSAGLKPKVQKIYDLYGAGNKFMVYETLGKHEDTVELRAGEYPLDEPLAQGG